MDITYEQYQRRQGPNRRGGKRTAKKSRPMERREVRRLAQLAASILIFAVVFIGRGVFPERAAVLQENLREVLQESVDFTAAFSALGQSVSQGEPLPQAIGSWCAEVFSPTQVTVSYAKGWEHSPTFRQEQEYLAAGAEGIGEINAHYLLRAVDQTEKTTYSFAPALQTEQSEVQPEESGAEPEAVEEVPAASTAEAVYDGPALPAGVSMTWQALPLDQTVTPVMGVVSSPYGYRQHPLDGEYKFHYGVDIAADEGTAIGAFAAGVVEYIGSSDSYGNYIQIDHGNGVTTFYCHCQELLKQTGDTVAAGETIALVGQTGNTTGPHLHFALQADGVYLNPESYIETENSQT